jgi:hypothetical protein
MEEYKNPDPYSRTIDLLIDSRQDDCYREEQFDGAVFTDTELTYREQCDYFLSCSYEHLLKHEWYELSAIFTSHLEENISLLYLCIGLRSLNS